MACIKLRLSVLNSAKTSYTAFALEADSFFQDYSFGILRDANSARLGQSNKFCCQVYLKVRLFRTWLQICITIC